MFPESDSPAPDDAATGRSGASDAAAGPAPQSTADSAVGLKFEPKPAPEDPGLAPSFLDWSSTVELESGTVVAIDPAAETVTDQFPKLPPINAPVHRPAVMASTSTAPPDNRVHRRPSLLMIGLISYASAATLALLYFYFASSRARPHALESLPDVPPLDVQHGEVMKLAPADADLPPGHELALGDSRRFGNILVEPLRVVAEPLTFEHFSDRSGIVKEPTGKVLKMWLRFTNVSDGQAIAPLDSDLLFRRAVLDDVARANPFVCRAADRKADASLVLMYDHPTTSEWDLSDQHLGVVLQPGESVETYLPSGEDGAALTGPLLWRVHFRKGYSPRGYGVTTLVDVLFDADDVQPGPTAG